MADTKPVELKSLKPGHYVMVDGEPCRVVSITKSKPGKHGSAKGRVETMGLFDGKKHYIMKPMSANVDVPIVEKKRGQVIALMGDNVQMMDMEDYSTFELPVPEEFKGKLEAGTEVLYWKLAGKTIIKEIKTA